MSDKAYKFDDFIINTRMRQLSRGTEIIKLSSYAYEILLFLIQRQGEVVRKEELLSAVWKGVFIEETNLAVHVSALRRVLREKRGDNKFIETISGRGYCFVAPVEVVELNQTSASTQIFQRGDQLANKIPFLAVLPLTTEGDDASFAYLSESISEELIYTLSKLHRLKVTAWNAVSHYKNKNRDFQEIGFVLGAEAILTGHIRQVEKHLEVSIELVNVFDRSHIWGHQYYCSVDDIIKIKSEISLAVAESLQIELKGYDARQITHRSTISSEAHNLFMKGRHMIAKREKDSMLRGIEFFRRAIKKDPNYALAYTGIADTYFMLSIYNMYAPAETISRAKRAVDRALVLDDKLSEAHASNGLIQYRYDWKWKEADFSFKRAISLNPNNSVAMSYYSSFLLYVYGNRIQEALTYRNKGLELDPFSPLYNLCLITHFNFTKEYGRAITAAEDFLEIDPFNGMVFCQLAFSHANLQLYDAAFDFIERALEVMPLAAEVVLLKGWIHVSAGDAATGYDVLAEISSNTRLEGIDYYDIATVHTALGDEDEAFKWLEMAVKARSLSICGLRIDPRFDRLRSDPQFTTLLEQVGLQNT
jgi:DNA-binding winged helix-turn-helix (wHTH) protein/Tfp pilus assembly protein PilF